MANEVEKSELIDVGIEPAKTASVPPVKKPEIPAAPVKLRKPGRPAGSKTRPDSPRMVKAAMKQAQTSAASGNTPTDFELFGSQTPSFSSPPAGSSAPPAPETAPENPEAEKPDPQPAEVHRPMATLIWDSIVSFLVVFMGKFWLPRPVGSNVEKGELPYDEREMVIAAFCKYLASVGMMVMSPAQELWLAIGTYCAPRLLNIFGWIQSKLFRRTQTRTEQNLKPDSRQAETKSAPDVQPSVETPKQPPNAPPVIFGKNATQAQNLNLLDRLG